VAKCEPYLHVVPYHLYFTGWRVLLRIRRHDRGYSDIRKSRA
jgi:hypothetical protein